MLFLVRVEQPLRSNCRGGLPKHWHKSLMLLCAGVSLSIMNSMLAYTDPVFFFLWCCVVFGALGVLVSVIQSHRRQRKYASQCAVKPELEYPNNHHVLGVGYYHAASGKWFPHPWNEYREGRGYYWDGQWQDQPDQRQVQKSRPAVEEVPRVNAAWRQADPDRARQFWAQVEHEGFGTAIKRSEGS